MAKMTMAICGEPMRFDDGTSGWKIHRYAYLDDIQEGERVKDARYINKLVDRLMGEESTWHCDERPASEHKRMFDVMLEVKDHGKPTASYKADYRKYNGCPLKAVEDGMEIYHSIRKFGVRPANKQVVACNNYRREHSEAIAKREASIVRFVVGKRYFADTVDAFNHTVRKEIVWDGRKSKKVRCHENGNEYVRLGNDLIFCAENVVV